MNRRYFFPSMAIAAAAILYFFGDRTPDNQISDKREKPMKSSEVPVQEPSFVPDPLTVGTLHVGISFSGRKTPEQIEGSLDLIKLNDNGIDEPAKSFEITSPLLSCEFLAPGRYRIEATIALPDSDYSFITKPITIEILPGKTITHDIVIP